MDTFHPRSGAILGAISYFLLPPSATSCLINLRIKTGRFLTLAVSQCRVCVFVSTQFEAADATALRRVLSQFAGSQSTLKMRP